MTVFSAFMFSFYLRFRSDWLVLPPVENTAQYVKGALLLTVIWVLFLWREDSYAAGFRGLSAPMIRLRSLVFSAGGAISALLVISFLYRDLLLSRQVYLTTTVIGLSGMVLTRITMRALERDLAAQQLGVKRILVLGQDPQVTDFIHRLRRDYPFYELVTAQGLPVDTDMVAIKQLYDGQDFDKIVLSLSEMDRALSAEESLPRIIEMLNYCEARGITLYAIPNSFNVVVNQAEVASLSGMPLIRLQDAARHPGYAVVKRGLDIVLSTCVLLVGMPLWATIALLIKCTSKGPVFFTGERIGLHGIPFQMYKFRSMYTGAEADFDKLVDIDKLQVPGVKIQNDPRVTPVGRLLRRTSLDEIPQVFNVLKGEMTWVGPRPEVPCLVDRYDAFARRRLKGKPGITGFQQVMARNEPLAGAIKLDLAYLKEQGLLFDLYIMARTVPVMVKGR